MDRVKLVSNSLGIVVSILQTVIKEYKEQGSDVEVELFENLTDTIVLAKNILDEQENTTEPAKKA